MLSLLGITLLISIIIGVFFAHGFTVPIAKLVEGASSISKGNFDYAMQVHNLTYEKMRKAKASSNPLLFCEGGCLVKLDPNDTIEEALKSATYSIGYIGLEEVSYLMTGKHLHQDNSFAIEVLDYLNNKIEIAKKETGKLIALYGTPKMLGL